LPLLPFAVNPDWRDEAKKNIPGSNSEKEVIINGVCVMNQSSDFKSDDEDANANEDKLTIADASGEDEIKKSFIKKPPTSMDCSKSVDGDDDDVVNVKKEMDEGGDRWEY